MAFSDENGLAVFDGNAQTRDGLMRIKKAAWLGPGGTDADLVLTDAHGDDLGTLTAGQAGGVVNLTHLENKLVTDLTVTTIDSGKLYVNYE